MIMLLVVLGFAAVIINYMVGVVGGSMTVLLIMAAIGVHAAMTVLVYKRRMYIKSATNSGNSETKSRYRELTKEEIATNPEYNIVYTSDKSAGKHNDIEIPAYIIMANDSVYQYDRIHPTNTEPKLSGTEIVLDSGLVYKKSNMTGEDLRSEILRETFYNMGIDATLNDTEITKLSIALESILSDPEYKEPVEPSIVLENVIGDTVKQNKPKRIKKNNTEEK